MRPTLGPAALLAALLAAAPAAAGEKLRTEWIVQPPAPVPAGPVRAAPGDVVLEQKLLPSGLALLRETYRESGARWIVEAGAELFEVKGSAAAIYCVIDNRPPSKIARILSAQPYKEHLCFIDRDHDGRFEMSFITSNTYSDLPGIFRGITPSDKSITPRAYEKVDPRLFSRETNVALRYVRRKGDKLHFTLAYGSDVRRTALSLPSVRIRTLPAEFELLGARFRVTEATDAHILIELLAPMPEKPFGGS
jgi:hypothetical protein